MELLGSPELQYPAIHITGTNGKTSTARMTTALLVAAGLSVGTDTSPYLARVNERMSGTASPSPTTTSTDPGPVADIEALLPERPSYIEIINAAACGGSPTSPSTWRSSKWGSAATGTPPTSSTGESPWSPTSSIDHVEYLGPTRAGIAEEKAGIVKPGSTLVLGETDPELVPIFLARDPASSCAAASTSV